MGDDENIKEQQIADKTPKKNPSKKASGQGRKEDVKGSSIRSQDCSWRVTRRSKDKPSGGKANEEQPDMKTMATRKR